MDVKRLEHLETANQLKQEATGALFWIDKRTPEGQLAHAKLRGVLNRKYP